MALPIPLHCHRDAENIGTGTGFVVRNDNAHWLLTCAHLFTSLNPTPANVALFENKKLTVVGLPITIPTFTYAVGRFRLTIDRSDDSFWDLISLKLTLTEVAALKCFGAYDANYIVEVQPGDSVTVCGFPGLRFDQVPHSTQDAQVTEVVGATFALSAILMAGYSGGPVMRGENLVGIAFGDCGEQGNLQGALAISLSLFAHHYCGAD